MAIPLADETQGVQVKLCYPLTMHAIPERLRDASCVGSVQLTPFNYTVNIRRSAKKP